MANEVKMGRIERLSRIIELLSKDRTFKHADFLAEETGRDVRTIYRDIDVIENFLGIGSVERTSDGYRIIGKDLVEILTKNDDYSRLAAIKQSPLGGLLDRRIKVLDNIIAKVAPLLDIKGKIPDMRLRYLFEGMNTGKYLTMLYRSKNELNRHEIVPIKLYLDYSLLYVVAYDEGYGHLITLGASKIESLTPMNHHKMPMSELKRYRDYVNSGWGKMLLPEREEPFSVQFKVDNSIIKYFQENPIHVSQIWQAVGDEFIISLKAHHPVEFTRWSLRFGAHLKILEPQEFIDELRNYLYSMQKMYEE